MANTINKIIRNWTEYEFKDTTYTAGTGISISAQNVISNTQTSAEWWNITGTLSDQTDLNTALSGKQDSLSTGTWISISSNTISNTLPFDPASAWSTWNVLTKTANWYDWSAPAASWIQCDPNSPITIDKIRVWTESDYSNLGTYSTTTAYMTV